MTCNCQQSISEFENDIQQTDDLITCFPANIFSNIHRQEQEDILNSSTIPSEKIDACIELAKLMLKIEDYNAVVKYYGKAIQIVTNIQSTAYVNRIISI